MSFIPQLPIDPTAVFGSLRVNLQNNVHAGERIIDVALDTASDLTHHTAVLANAGALSTIEMQQAMLGARSGQDAWKLIADHANRLREHYLKYLDECLACRQRASNRIFAEDDHVDH